MVEAVREECKKAGLIIHGCFMVGNPGDTKETMEETFQLSLKLNPDTAQFFPLMVYPGTEAYKWAQIRGYLTTNDFSKWVTEDGLHSCIISTPEISAEELVAFCDEARRRYYLRPAYIFPSSGSLYFIRLKGNGFLKQVYVLLNS